MTDKQLATIMNNAVKPNMLGYDGQSPFTVVAEDFSNYVEFGKDLSSLSVTDLEDYKQRIAVQIRNAVILRILDKKEFRMYKDNIEFAGALQRIMAAGLADVKDSHQLNLVSGTDYTDGVYYDTGLDSKIFIDTVSYKIPWSISDDSWALAFSDAAEMVKVMAIIENRVENTTTAYLNALVKKIFCAMIEKCNTAGRKVQLLTKFNDLTGGNPATGSDYTLDEIYADRKLYAYFSDFVKGVIGKLTQYVREINRKYNNTEIETFTPADKIETVMIADFYNDIMTLGNPVDFNAPALNIEQITCWQTCTDAILPTLADVSSIKVAGDPSATTISNVVALIYDVDCCGIESVRSPKITTSYIGSEGFTNYYAHHHDRYFYDDRLGSVILTLD